MRISLRDTDRRLLGVFDVDNAALPPTIAAESIRLHWKSALDSRGRLIGCPACGCRQLFRRRDFPQRVGLSIVLIAAAGSFVLFALNMVVTSFAVLVGAAVLDAILFFFTSQCLVCYRCRTEYRGLPVDAAVHHPWDLAIGEKYRPPAPAPGAASDSAAGAINHDS